MGWTANREAHARMEQLPVAVNKLLRSLRRLQDSSHIPVVVVPNETNQFVHSLLPLCDTPDKPLFNFVIHLPSDSLETELLKTAIDQQLLTLRNEHDRLALEKEEAVVNQDFVLAAECRDKQGEIVETINDMAPNPIQITSSHLAVALKSLGFDGDVTI